MDFFSSRLHKWYSENKRDLPWRSTRDPYLIWLSEIILQQTRVDQGMKYYLRFAEEFPTIVDLASASEDRILKLWQGLGYYSRARNLHYTAKFIQERYNGVFPDDYIEIRALKGVGDYTAAAIASISFNMEYPTVDGNVYRVLSRFYGITDPIDTGPGKKLFAELAATLIRGSDPGYHNQAMMEFGALQCTPKNPDCLNCVMAEQCFAYSTGKINELPVKQKSVSQRNRYFNYLVIVNHQNTWLRKRVGKDIWKNLFEFPVIETPGETSPEALFATGEFTDLVKSARYVVGNISEWKTHVLSHQRINYRFIIIRPEGEFEVRKDLIRVNKEDIYNFAVPRLLEVFLNESKFYDLFI